MRYEIISTGTFDKWLLKLRDRQAVLAIANRMTRAAAGNLGDVKQKSWRKNIRRLP